MPRKSGEMRGDSDEGKEDFDCGDFGRNDVWRVRGAGGEELVEEGRRGDGGGRGAGYGYFCSDRSNI